MSVIAIPIIFFSFFLHFDVPTINLCLTVGIMEQAFNLVAFLVSAGVQVNFALLSQDSAMSV